MIYIFFALFTIVLLFVFFWWLTKPIRCWHKKVPIWKEVAAISFSEGGIKNASVVLYDAPTCDLSVVIPAYNEEKRLPAMLKDCMNYLKSRCQLGCNFEIIIVDDGSTDRTYEFACKAAVAYSDCKFDFENSELPVACGDSPVSTASTHFKIISLSRNMGKGYSVKTGMHFSSGAALLIADADGATKFSSIDQLTLHFSGHIPGISILDIAVDDKGKPRHAVCVGSRAKLPVQVNRSFWRKLCKKIFLGFFAIVCKDQEIEDTQCGFKLLTQPAARVVFSAIHNSCWAFDVELILLARKSDFTVKEVPVTWTEVSGSKLSIMIHGFEMVRDILWILIMYRYAYWFPKITRSEASSPQCPRGVEISFMN
eukprot:GHVR01186527.1.p1 GENE.GHVR01186527.1~~GHVR01186527.1.p1  ORF type:complete len:368 (+),score=8.99 GHVR01186527.1:25-1128(+)